MHCTSLTHHFRVDDLKPAQDTRETVGSCVHCALSVKGLWVGGIIKDIKLKGLALLRMSYLHTYTHTHTQITIPDQGWIQYGRKRHYKLHW